MADPSADAVGARADAATSAETTHAPSRRSAEPTPAVPPAAPLDGLVANTAVLGATEADTAALPNDAPLANAAPAAASPAEAPAASTPLPKVQAFALPVSELASVAEGSGLQWVNSDADRIAAANRSLAEEAKPIHVPRERRPAAVIEDAKLTLVETRRDLNDVVLPFEKQDGPR